MISLDAMTFTPANITLTDILPIIAKAFFSTGPFQNTYDISIDEAVKISCDAQTITNYLQSNQEILA